MTTRLVGSYHKFNTVPSRSVVQVIIEFPIESAVDVVEVLGIPNPAEPPEVSVEIAEPVREFYES